MEFLSPLMGVNFRPASAKAVVDELHNGVELTLERDPYNEYDVNAIKVIDPASGEFLGFVAKEVAAELAPLLDEGQEFTVKVIGWLATRKPHLQITPADAD